MNDLLAVNITPTSVIVENYTVYSINLENTETIRVYNNDGDVFNAFRYNLNGTFYYYVLDSYQTQWVNNLESINYSDKMIYKSYVNADKITQKEIGPHLGVILYDKYGNKIDWNWDWGTLYNYDVPYTVISVDGSKENPLPGSYTDYTVSQAVQFTCVSVSSGGFPVVTNYYLGVRLNQTLPDSVKLSLSYIQYVDI